MFSFGLLLLLLVPFCTSSETAEPDRRIDEKRSTRYGLKINSYEHDGNMEEEIPISKSSDRNPYPRFFNGNTKLDEALVTSMLPQISSKCRARSTPIIEGESITSQPRFNFTMDFVSSKNRSQWSPVNAPFEEDIFLMEMTFQNPPLFDSNVHKPDASAENRTSRAVNVTVRIGTGGNIYSHYVEDYDIGQTETWRGKETVAPQSHTSSPFNDEVWQLVGIDINKNGEAKGLQKYKYFIHQAGTYLRDPTGGLGTEDTNRTRAFSSPTVAYHCNITESSCTIISWGQHAHVPTIHRSNVLYVTRYVACDSRARTPEGEDGSVVIEITNGLMVMKEADEDTSADTINYFNVPWGGVRETTFRDVLWGSRSNETHKEDVGTQVRPNLKTSREGESNRYNSRRRAANDPMSMSLGGALLSTTKQWLSSFLRNIAMPTRRNTTTKMLEESKTSPNSPREVVTENCTIDKSHPIHKPLPGFGSGHMCNVDQDTGGYITFAEKVHDPDMVPFHLPCLNTKTGKVVRCPTTTNLKTAANLRVNKEQMSLIQEDIEDAMWSDLSDSLNEDLHEIAFREDMQFLLQHSEFTSFDEQSLIANLNFSKHLDNGDIRNHSSALNLEEMSTSEYDHGDEPIEQLRLIISSIGDEPIQVSKKSETASHETLAMLTARLEDTFAVEMGCSCVFNFINSKNSTLRGRATAVMSWSRGGKFLVFQTSEGGGDPHEAAAFFNARFERGDEILVEYANEGLDCEQNMALTLVMGNKYYPGFEHAYSMARVGTTYRDYLVYEAVKHIEVKPGMIYTKRHYLATGHLDNADDRAQVWRDEVLENLHDFSGDSNVNRTKIVLHSNIDASIVGVTVGSDDDQSSCGPPGSMTLQRCQGYASPTHDTVRLFAIDCGGPNETYIGHNLYHFAPKTPLDGDDEKDILYHRPYICDGHGAYGRRPRWKLLGFFPPGACDSVQSASFDPTFCDSLSSTHTF